MKYPYRFKTEKEFIEEFGRDWHDEACWNQEGLMDYLFGTEFKFDYDFKDNYETIDIKNENILCRTRYSWSINMDMLTKNTPIKPNYTPKRKRFEYEISI